MIARLEGTLHKQTPTRVVIDVNGVGYELSISLATFTQLPDEGKNVALHVYTHARDGSIALYGFHAREERKAFELLLRASRVGPRLAQTILSGLAPADLLAAIREGNVRALQAVPGVGTKMAERILVELRDRAGELAAALDDAAPPGLAAPSRRSGGPREEALSALVNLGYARAEADRILGEAAEDADDATLESLVRAALRRLAQ